MDRITCPKVSVIQRSHCYYVYNDSVHVSTVVKVFVFCCIVAGKGKATCVVHERRTVSSYGKLHHFAC